MKRTKAFRPGHVIEIPLLDGRYAYALYVMKSGWGANIIWVFDPVHPAPIQSLEGLKPKFLFPPTQTFLGDGVKYGGWSSLGKYWQTIQIPHPTFRSPSTKGWRLWSGGGFRFSDELPDGTMEYDLIWSFNLIERRIRLGITDPVYVGPNSPLNVET